MSAEKEAPLPPEAEIVINGEKLSYAEALTLRVAVMNFMTWLGENDLGVVGANYAFHCGTIYRKMTTRV